MNSNWKTIPLDELVNIRLSGVDKHIVPGETSVRLCNYLDVYRNRRLSRAIQFALGSASGGEIARFRLQEGDVLITKDSETPDDIGIPSVVVEDLGETICGYHLALLRPKRDVNPSFLSFQLQSDMTKRHFLKTALGVTRFGLGIKAIASLPVLVPSPEEQATVVRILDAVDTAVERTRKAIEKAKELKNALLQKFFYQALGEAAYADRPKKRLPKGWDLLATETLLAKDPKNGVSPKASSQPPGIPTFSIAAVREGQIDLNKREHLKYAQIPEVVADQFRVSRGDVLIVRGNANLDLVGKAGMIDRFPEGCIYPDITKRVVFRTEGEQIVLPEFAVLAWNHPIVHNQVLRRAKTSNGTLKINNRDVRQIVMPVPPRNEQSGIVALSAGVDARVRALTELMLAQDQLKRSLMHDLLTGDMRVNDIDLDKFSTS